MKISDFFRDPAEFAGFCNRIFLSFQRNPRDRMYIPLQNCNSVRVTENFTTDELLYNIPTHNIEIPNPFYLRPEGSNNPYTILKWDIMEAIGNLEVNRT